METQPIEAYFFSTEKIELGKIYVNRSRHFDSTLKQDFEGLLERVRTEKCESLPTRIDAIFVSPSKEISLDWFQTIYINEIRNESLNKCYVYKVQVTGEVKWFEGKYYNMLGQPFCISKKTPEELAKSYWDSISDTPHFLQEEEGLVTGSIKFLQEYSFIQNEYGDFIEQH